MQKLRIGTRGSRLALAQAGEVIERLGSEVTVITYETAGDIDKHTPIERVEGTDFFTNSIEDALINGEIDIAVHSAKDLPDQIPDRLTIVAVTSSINPSDVLVSRKNLKLKELPSGARVGTSSARRKEQLLKIRPDLKVIDLRGNIDERLSKLDKGEFDAVVIAAAGLIRLGLADRISERLPFKTAHGQGCLALEVREKDKELQIWLKSKFI